MVVSCGGNKTSKIHRLYRDQLYAAPASCSALISNTKIPTKQNFIQREAQYLSKNGERLFAGLANSNKDDTILWRHFLPYYTNIDTKATEWNTKNSNITAKIEQVLKEKEKLKDPSNNTSNNMNGSQSMVTSIIAIGLILSMYLALRVIRIIRKKQKKANYNIELKRRPSEEKLKDFLEEYKLEATDEDNIQSQKSDNSDLHVNKVSDTIHKAGEPAPEKDSNNVGDRHNMLNQLREKNSGEKDET